MFDFRAFELTLHHFVNSPLYGTLSRMAPVVVVGGGALISIARDRLTIKHRARQNEAQAFFAEFDRMRQEAFAAFDEAIMPEQPRGQQGRPRQQTGRGQRQETRVRTENPPGLLAQLRPRPPGGLTPEERQLAGALIHMAAQTGAGAAAEEAAAPQGQTRVLMHVVAPDAVEIDGEEVTRPPLAAVVNAAVTVEDLRAIVARTPDRFRYRELVLMTEAERGAVIIQAMQEQTEARAVIEEVTDVGGWLNWVRNVDANEWAILPLDTTNNDAAVPQARKEITVPIPPPVRMPYDEVAANKIVDVLAPFYLGGTLNQAQRRLELERYKEFREYAAKAVELTLKLEATTDANEFKSLRNELEALLTKQSLLPSQVMTQMKAITVGGVTRTGNMVLTRRMNREFLLEQVKALWDKYGGVKLVTTGTQKYISVYTEEITLKYDVGGHWKIVLGPFEIQWRFKDFTGTNATDANRGFFFIETTRPDRNSKMAGYIHPHTPNGQACLGDASKPVPNFVNTGMIFQAFGIMDNLLHNYRDEGDRFSGSIKKWGNLICEICNDSVDTADSKACYACNKRFCKTCTFTCDRCNRGYCKNCGIQDVNNEDRKKRRNYICPCIKATIECKGCHNLYDTADKNQQIHGYDPDTNTWDTTKTGYCPYCLAIWAKSAIKKEDRKPVTRALYDAYMLTIEQRNGPRTPITRAPVLDPPTGLNTDPFAFEAELADPPIFPRRGFGREGGRVQTVVVDNLAPLDPPANPTRNARPLQAAPPTRNGGTDITMQDLAREQRERLLAAGMPVEIDNAAELLEDFDTIFGEPAADPGIERVVAAAEAEVANIVAQGWIGTDTFGPEALLAELEPDGFEPVNDVAARTVIPNDDIVLDDGGLQERVLEQVVPQRRGLGGLLEHIRLPDVTPDQLDIFVTEEAAEAVIPEALPRTEIIEALPATGIPLDVPLMATRIKADKYMLNGRWIRRNFIPLR